MTERTFGEGLAALEARTRRASIALWLFMAIALLAAAGELMEATQTVTIDGSEFNGAVAFVAFAYIGYSTLFLVSVVLVSMWIHRAHANLFAAGLDDLEFTPGWSVGWFFVPVANLVKPFQAMRELWSASYGTDNSYGSATPAAVGTWWGCFIAGNILSNIGSRIQTGGAGTDAARVGAALDALGTVITVAAAWFLLQIIREVMEGQRNHLQVSEAFA